MVVKKKLGDYIFDTFNYILLAFIASYGRGDALSDYIGDS